MLIGRVFILIKMWVDSYEGSRKGGNLSSHVNHVMDTIDTGIDDPVEISYPTTR